MKYTELDDMIGQTGLPRTYYSWPEDDPANPVPELPYIVWYLPGTSNFAADDSVYQLITTLNVELYTATKNFDTELLVESVLDSWNMVWDKTESYIESEHMYEVLYTMEVVINA